MFRFTLRQLLYFRVVADQGGIAQAARQLNVAQPSVAQALEKLEDLTGLVLLERHHARGVSLTAQGRHFLAQAESLLDHAEQVVREAAALAAEEAGEIRLGCFPTIAAFYLPGLIRSHRKAYPGTRITAEETTMDLLASRTRAGSLDLCLTYDIADTLEGLDVHRLLAVAPRVLLPCRHPKARACSVRLSELADEPYVMFDAPGSREYFTGLLDDAGLSPEIAYASQSLEGVRSAVGAGFGFSVAALLPGQNKTYEGNGISVVALKGQIRSLDIVLASRRTGRENTLVTRFADHARQYMSTVD